MSNGNQDGPDVSMEAVAIGGDERWRLSYGKGTIYVVASPPQPPIPAVHLATNHMPPSVLLNVRGIVANGGDFDDVLGALGSYAADFGGVPNADRSLVVDRLAYCLARAVIEGE